MMFEGEWTFDLRRCLDATGAFLPPDRIPLSALLDVRRLVQIQNSLSAITQIEASVSLYDEEFPVPVVHDLIPMDVRSPLCRELNALEDPVRGMRRCAADTGRAAHEAMRRGEPVVADCVGGKQTLWSCPVLLTDAGRVYPKAAITVAAFPLSHFLAEEVLGALFPEGNPNLCAARARAAERVPSEEVLSGVREAVRLLAEALSAEITLRYALARESVRASARPVEDLSTLVTRVSHMAHEVNNRLTSILLHADLARRWGEAPEIREPLELIQGEARSAIETVRALTRLIVKELSSGVPSEGESAPSPPSPEPPPVRAKRILVIDDERPVAELIQRALRAHHYDVDISLDGQQAIAMIEEKRYDLIVADLRMPGLGGIEVYEHFRHADPEIARRIVFLSGDVLSAQALTFLRETGSPHLPKPCTLEELLAFVEAGLQRASG